MFEREKLAKHWKSINPIYSYIVLGYLALMLIIGGFIIWAQNEYLNPERTFWATINNNLATNGVTKISDQTSQQNVQIKTLSRLSFSPNIQVHSFRKITDNSTTPSSKLTLESIGTTDADFQRYSHIERSLQNGKPIDYSAVYPLWILSSTNGRSPQQLSSALFAPFLFGNLPANERQDVMSSLYHAYTQHFIKGSQGNNRRVYTYKVSLSMQNYARAVQKYGKILGVKQAEAINPNSYSKDNVVEMEVKIDAISRQLISLVRSGTTELDEKYASYGISDWQQPPTKTASLQDLQKAIQSATP